MLVDTDQEAKPDREINNSGGENEETEWNRASHRDTENDKKPIACNATDGLHYHP